MATNISTSEIYRSAFAPVHVVRHEWLKASERVTRLQMAIAEDIVDHGFASIHAMADTNTPAEYLSKQAQLTSDLFRKSSDHVQSFINESSTSLDKSAESAANAAREFGEAAKRAGKDAQQFVQRSAQSSEEVTKQASGQR